MIVSILTQRTQTTAMRLDDQLVVAIFILLTLQHNIMIYGRQCDIVYLVQPPLSLECNPIAFQELSLQLECQDIGNKEFTITWYHNNTEGFIKKLDRGVETTVGQTSADSDEAALLANSKFFLNSTKNYYVHSKLTVGEVINSLEADSSDRQIFYKLLEGHYWCEINQQQQSNTSKRSNMLELKRFIFYSNFQLCKEPQSVVKVECAAKQTKLNSSSTVVDSASSNTHTVTASYYTTSESTSLKYSETTTIIGTLQKSTDQNMQPSTVPENQSSNTLFNAASGKLSNLLNIWEIIIVCLCGITVTIMIISAVAIGLYVYMQKRKRNNNSETPLAMTKFDNPIYNKSEEYIYPVTTQKTNLEVEYEYTNPKVYTKEIEDTPIYYYTKPIPLNKDDNDDCYEKLSDTLKTLRECDKNGASQSSSHQYQSLERNTINYVSIYDMLQMNDNSSRSGSDKDLQESAQSTITLHSSDNEYDYVNVKK